MISVGLFTIVAAGATVVTNGDDFGIFSVSPLFSSSLGIVSVLSMKGFLLFALLIFD